MPDAEAARALYIDTEQLLMTFSSPESGKTIPLVCFNHSRDSLIHTRGMGQGILWYASSSRRIPLVSSEGDASFTITANQISTHMHSNVLINAAKAKDAYNSMKHKEPI